MNFYQNKDKNEMSVMVTNFKCEKKTIVLLICEDRQDIDRIRKLVNSRVPNGIPGSLNKKYSKYGHVVSIRSTGAREHIKKHAKSLGVRIISVIEQL